MPFNTQAALQAGYNQDEINQYLATRQGRQSQPQSGGLIDWLPAIGAIGGSFIPGAGTIAGGALGAGAGALLKQSLVGGGPEEIVKEAALGGVGGVVGKGIGAVAGKLLPKGIGKAAGQVAAKGVGQTAGRGVTQTLAAKTIASNFTIPPKLAPQLQIEDALGQMIQDGIKIPSSIKGYQRIANQITGSDGAITSAQRIATKQVKTPINFDQALTDAKGFVGLKGSLSADEKLDTLATLRNYFNNRKYPIPGHITADDALDIANQLDKEGFNLLHKGVNELSPNAMLEAKGEAFIGVAEDLRNQLSRGIDSSGIFAKVQAEAVKTLEKISPQLAERARLTTNMSQLRSVASPYVRINRAAQSTINRQQTPFVGGGLQLGTRAAGALAGGGIAGLPGAAAGAAFAPMAAGAAQAAQPAITGLAAKGILETGKIAGKIPRPGGLATATTGQLGVRAGLPQPQQPEVQEELPPSPAQSQNLTSQNDQLLRTAFAQAILQNPKQASAIKAAYDLLSGGAGGNLTAGLKKQMTSIDNTEGLINELETLFYEAGTTEGPLARVTGLGRKAAGAVGLNESAKIYEREKEAFISQISKALGGDVGALSNQDIQRAISALPDLTSTAGEARKSFTIVKNLINKARRNVQKQSGETSIPLPQDYFSLTE